MTEVSLREHFDMRFDCLEEQRRAEAKALDIQAVEYQRRLDKLDRDLGLIVGRLIASITVLVAVGGILLAMVNK